VRLALFILQACLFWIFVLVWHLFYCPLFSVLSILLWKFLWLNEEVLTLFCFFLVVRMDISWFSWDIYIALDQDSSQLPSCRNFWKLCLLYKERVSTVSAKNQVGSSPWQLMISVYRATDFTSLTTHHRLISWKHFVDDCNYISLMSLLLWISNILGTLK
jgi:hypothetical protein